MTADGERIGMGFWDWIRGRTTSARGASTTASATVNVRLSGTVPSGGDDGAIDPRRHDASLDQADHLAHEVMTTGWAAGPVDLRVSSSTSVIVDGKTVDPADPRAQAAIRTAVDTLRAQGLTDLAGDLEKRLAGVAPTGVVPVTYEKPPVAESAASDAGRTISAPAMAAPAAADPQTPDPPAGETPSPPSAPAPPSESI
jgi:hypothetical protein